MILCKEGFAKDLDRTVFPGTQGGPLVHIIAAKAVCFLEAQQPDYKSYIQQVVKNAQALAETIKARGYRIVSGGTDNHLLLVDVFSRGITGKQAEKALEIAGMTVNKNTIPYDINTPMVTSGIRLGTPALTSRGMEESEMKAIGAYICDVLDAIQDEAVQAGVKARIAELTRQFPLYQARTT
jgi:glycine hydroxymethyltransferase